LPSLYLESTIPSYLTAWPANDLIAAAHQAMTREWWQLRRDDFELYTSQLVIEEISAGDPTAAKLRLAALDQIRLLPLTDEVEWIATELSRKSLVPKNAEADAFHIAFATSHKLDYLLTWNCKHIANAERLPSIEKFLSDSSFHIPIVCTPEELMGG
jgi:predicted nucleic acid-binding protein